MRPKIIIAIILLVFVSYSIAGAYTHRSSDYTLKDPEIIPSYGESSSTDYSLKSVQIGDITGGKAGSSDYSLEAFPLDIGVSPDAPTAAPLPSITNNPRQLLSGTKDKGASVCVNGYEAVPLDNETTWSAYVMLKEGDNTLIVTSKNIYNQESDSVTINVMVDTTPPVIAITSPKSYAVITSSPVTVTGTINEEAAVYVNGVSPEISGGSFTISVNVTPGKNLITAMAADTAGNQSLTDYIIVGLNTDAPVITNFDPPDKSLTQEGSTAVVRVEASDKDTTDLWYSFFVKNVLRQDWSKGRNIFNYYVSQAEIGLAAIRVEVADSDPNGRILPNVVTQSSRIYNFRKPVLPAALE